MHTMDTPDANGNEPGSTVVASEETEYEKALETDLHPMSEGMYNMLSSVRGFVEMNGATYDAYVAGWRERRDKSLSDAST